MNNIITADQVQEGDRIKVTQTHADRVTTDEGVAGNFTAGIGGRPRWRTARDMNLWTDERTAVIELLDRPKPKIAVPTLPNAVATYMYGWAADGDLQKRTVVRDFSKEGCWIAYDDGGQRMNGFKSDEYFSQSLSERESMRDFKVLFAGVVK